MSNINKAMGWGLKNLGTGSTRIRGVWVCQRKREIRVGRRDVKSEKREAKEELATAVAHIGQIRYSSKRHLIRNRNSNLQ